MIKFQNLVTGYKSNKKETKLISQVENYSIPLGRLVFILGLNGSGKSTLMNTILGDLPPISGQVLLDGLPVHQIKPPKKARLISLLSSNITFPSWTTVKEFVSLGRQPHTPWHGRLSQADQSIIDKFIYLLELKKLDEKQITEISDGEKQRALLALAFSQQTPVLLLDEPTVFLDIKSKIDFIYYIKNLVQQEKKTIFISTHDYDIAKQVGEIFIFVQLNQKVNITRKKSSEYKDLLLNTFLPKLPEKDRTKGKIEYDENLNQFVLID